MRICRKSWDEFTEKQKSSWVVPCKVKREDVYKLVEV